MGERAGRCYDWRLMRNTALGLVLIVAGALVSSGQAGVIAQAGSTLGVPGFHHMHLNSTNPDAAIDFYTRQFASTSRTTWGGMPALSSPNNVLILFTRVNTPPPTLEPPTAVWHFGWNPVDVRKSLAMYQQRPEVTLAPLYTGDGDKFVYVSSDTWPGPPGSLGRTRAQLDEAKAANLQPAGGAGFAYLRGPDGAIVEYAGDYPTERFNHVHMFYDEPRCATVWYRRHLNVPVSGQGAAGAALTEANCSIPHDYTKSWPALNKEGMVRSPAGGATFGDVAMNGYMRQDDRPLVSTRGHLTDHVGLSVTNLDAWVDKLRREGVVILQPPYPLGETRAAMIEGPSKLALELVELK
jgi:catechol 2,3-dioxygenase-like lactoylglutathione lyase family enzyme